MSRLSLTLAVLSCLAVPPLLVADDIFLRDDRPLTPAAKTFSETLVLTPAEAPMTPELKTAIEIVVRHVVYPMADPDKKIQNNPTAMSRQVDFCLGRIHNVFLAAEVKHTGMQDEFLRRMMTELNRLLAEPQQYPITRVNAARVAARLASLSQREEAADLLVKIVTDPKQVEGAKFYGLQGLKELQTKLALKQTPPIKDAKRRGEVMEALVAFVERKPPYTPNTDDEVEGLRYIRREAIRALAEVRESRLTGNDNGHVALALCRVVGKDKMLTPEVRIDEQLEAAVGLCRLPADPQKEFQAGYAAYLIAGFVKDFASRYQEARAVTRDAWRAEAARMRDGLKAMDTASGGDALVKTVQGLSDKILEDMEKGSRTINDKALTGWLEANKPTQKSVYKSEAGSVVTPRGAAPEKEK